MKDFVSRRKLVKLPESYGDSKLEPEALLSNADHVERLILNGQYLEAARVGRTLGYEFTRFEDIPKDYIDLARTKGFDVTQLSSIFSKGRAAYGRLRELARSSTSVKSSVAPVGAESSTEQGTST